jgi:hypothetical protein
MDGGSMATVLSPPGVVTSGTEMRIAGLYITGSSPTTLSPRTYTTTWTYANPHSRTHKLVVIHPLQQP